MLLLLEVKMFQEYDLPIGEVAAIMKDKKLQDGLKKVNEGYLKANKYCKRVESKIVEPKFEIPCPLCDGGKFLFKGDPLVSFDCPECKGSGEV